MEDWLHGSCMDRAGRGKVTRGGVGGLNELAYKARLRGTRLKEYADAPPQASRQGMKRYLAVADAIGKQESEKLVY